MLKSVRARKFSYKRGKKRTMPLYLINYVNEKKGNKSRKIGLEPRLVRAKEMMHDMLNMSMNELPHVWSQK